MALRDFFKRKKEPEKKKEEKKSSLAPAVEAKKEIKKETVKIIKKARRKTDEGFAYRILKAPHVTEKATDLAKNGRYVFKVYERANKTEIKRAVGNLYNVDVVSVKIIKVPSKKRIFKGIKGIKRGYKKAIVEVKKGQKIEIFPR